MNSNYSPIYISEGEELYIRHCDLHYPQGEIMFALVDVNSFYASCERIFRPDIANKPVIVLSNNDGCVCTFQGSEVAWDQNGGSIL